MKLPKTVLQALIIGISLQATVSSCKKETLKKPATSQEAKDDKKGGSSYPGNCPACGMG